MIITIPAWRLAPQQLLYLESEHIVESAKLRVSKLDYWRGCRNQRNVVLQDGLIFLRLFLSEGTQLVRQAYVEDVGVMIDDVKPEDFRSETTPQLADFFALYNIRGNHP